MASTLRICDGDGTTTGWTHSGGGTFAADVEAVASTDGDTSYILSPNVTSGTIWLTLQDMPGGFDPDGVTGFSIQVRCRRINVPVMAVDSGTITARLVRADETTAITTTPTAQDAPISGTYTTLTFTPSLTGTHTLDDFNGARLEIVFTHANNQNADTTNQVRVTSADVTITYDPTVPLHIRTGRRRPTRRKAMNALLMR